VAAGIGEEEREMSKPLKPRKAAIALLITAVPGITASTAGGANPYCVSGAEWSANGTMAKLNMPADSLGYIWDNLYSTNIPNMVRPCRYWQYLGMTHRFQGYHETDDTLDNPTAFGEWVDANPGKIWIIGNEPNLISQDGLTPAQYARMFKKYYDFILARDPSPSSPSPVWQETPTPRLSTATRIGGTRPLASTRPSWAWTCLSTSGTAMVTEASATSIPMRP